MAEVGGYFLLTVDRWFEARDIQGPWHLLDFDGARLDAAGKVVENSGQVSLMSDADTKKAFSGAIPAIHVSLRPSSAVVPNGKPRMQPISNAQLFCVTNNTNDLLFNTGGRKNHLRLTERWFPAPTPDGPWNFLRADALPPGFCENTSDACNTCMELDATSNKIPVSAHSLSVMAVQVGSIA